MNLLSKLKKWRNTVEVNDFTKFIVTGVIGAFVGTAATFYSFKSATTAENQFYMQMDFRRYQTASDMTVNVEERHSLLNKLKEAYDDGYEKIFVENLNQDIKEAATAIVRIQKRAKISEEAEAEARAEEQKRMAEMAEEKAIQAVRQNPVIFEACQQQNSKFLCP